MAVCGLLSNCSSIQLLNVCTAALDRVHRCSPGGAQLWAHRGSGHSLRLTSLSATAPLLNRMTQRIALIGPMKVGKTKNTAHLQWQLRCRSARRELCVKAQRWQPFISRAATAQLPRHQPSSLPCRVRRRAPPAHEQAPPLGHVLVDHEVCPAPVVTLRRVGRQGCQCATQRALTERRGRPRSSHAARGWPRSAGLTR